MMNECKTGNEFFDNMTAEELDTMYHAWGKADLAKVSAEAWAAYFESLEEGSEGA